MFRKPKRKAKNTLRSKEKDEDVVDAASSGTITHRRRDGDSQEDDDEDHQETTELLQEARKRVKSGTATTVVTSSTKSEISNSSSSVLPSFQTTKESVSDKAKKLVTSTAQHHPEERTGAAATATDADSGNDDDDDNNAGTTKKIYRGQNVERNKFHAGPIRAAAHVRVTARFDYQPDICKDYKETGFCGFGDTCIYLHDRGDTLTGWQLEQQYEEAQKQKRQQQQEDEMNKFSMMGGGDSATKGTKAADANMEDGIPFACHICREHFKEPVVTNCMHYFCEKCIMDHVRRQHDDSLCPICKKDTGSVFNEPTKLLAKKRKILGTKAAKADDSWQQYAKAFSG